MGIETAVDMSAYGLLADGPADITTTKTHDPNGTAQQSLRDSLRKRLGSYSTRLTLFRRFVMKTGVFVSPLYTLLVVINGQHKYGKHVSVRGMLTGCCELFPVIAMLVVSLLVIDAASREYIYYRMLQEGYLVQLESERIGRSFTLQWILFSGVFVCCFVVACVIVDGDYSRTRLQDCFVVFTQTLVLAALYFSNILKAQNNLVTLSKFVAQAPSIHEAAAQLALLEEVSQAEIQRRCLASVQRYMEWHRCKRTFRWWGCLALDVLMIGQLGYIQDY